uniref:Uncharacterized protein n=1 Tax=Anopheles darlingi TaxID=43151 RepID=A0A2M4CL33_ANODA
MGQISALPTWESGFSPSANAPSYRRSRKTFLLISCQLVNCCERIYGYCFTVIRVPCECVCVCVCIDQRLAPITVAVAIGFGLLSESPHGA